MKNKVEFILNKDIFFQNETQDSSENKQKNSKLIIKRKNQCFLQQQKRNQKNEAETQCNHLLIDQENTVEFHSLLIDQESELKYLQNQFQIHFLFQQIFPQ